MALKRGCVIQHRYIVAFMCILGQVISYTLRSLNTQLWKVLVKPPSNSSLDSRVWQCPRGPGNHDAPLPVFPDGQKYDWGDTEQRYVTIAFTVTYIFAHMPFGILANCVSGKWMMVVALAGGSLTAFFMPLLIHQLNFIGFIVYRVMLGCTQAALIPGISVMMARWIPTQELGRLAAPALGIGPFGVFLLYISIEPISAKIKWQYCCYMFGVLGLLWCVVFSLICFESPDQNPHMSQQERDDLNEWIPDVVNPVQFKSIPWADIFHSVPFWAIICTHIGHVWTFLPKINDAWTYLIFILRFPHESTRYIVGLQLLCYTFALISWGYLSDYMINKDLITLGGLRNMSTALSAIGSAVFILASNYARCQYYMVVFFLYVSMMSKSLFYNGAGINIIDVSRNYTGVITAMINGISVSTSVLRTLLNAHQSSLTLYQWRSTHYLGFVLVIVTTIIYLIWSSVERQSWDIPDGHRRSRVPLRIKKSKAKQSIRSSRPAID